MTVEALEREPPALPTEPVPQSPYPGLRSFVEAEADLFFGREREIATVLSLLEQQQLVVVHGASGCGKSSVVRAGVVPVFRLDALANDAQARVIVIRPADAGGPLASLARKLEREFPATGTADDPSGARRAWSEVMAASPNIGLDISRAARETAATLCLVIDQFEEIFAINRGDYAVEARRLIQFLVSLGEPVAPGTALGDRPLSVILTMRSDYLGQCALWDGFAEAVNRCQYLLPKMATVGVLRAIHEPARLFGGVVTEAAADRLLPIMTREIDGLPILQHALMRAWHVAAGPGAPPAIDPGTFDRIGGLDQALSRHAEEAFARATGGKVAEGAAALVNDGETAGPARATGGNPRLRDAADWMFRSLSALDTDERIIRRSVKLADLPAETGASEDDLKAILDVFRAPEVSLVTPYTAETSELDEQCIISVSHEAVLRQWDRVSNRDCDDQGVFKGLVRREVQDGLIARALSVQAEDFAANKARVLNPASTEARLPWFEEIGRRPGWIARYPLRRGPDRAERAREQWGKLKAFMAASKANLEVEKARLDAEKGMVARLRRNRRVLLVLSAVVVILLSIIITVLTLEQVKRTRQKVEEARVQRKQYELGKANQKKLNTALFLARRECAGIGLSMVDCPQTVTDKYLALYVPGIENANANSDSSLPYSGYVGGGYPSEKQVVR